MNRFTLAVLALLVAGLAWLAWNQARREDRERAAQDVALFEGVDENFIVGVRVENLGRDLHTAFVRDPAVGWRITDPVSGRADRAVLDLIVQAAAHRRGTPLSGDAPDLAKLGLDPPRFVLEIETEVDGARARQRAEFGAADLDGRHMYVRARGRTLRALRDLEPLLDLQLHEFRANAVTTLDARDVIEFERSGAVPAEGSGPPRDAAFAALAEQGVWRATAPVTGALDPGAMALLVQFATGMRIERRIDEGGRTPAALGLDPAELTVTLTTLRDEKAILVFGRQGSARQGEWAGALRGEPLAWSMEEIDVRFLATPVEDLLDHKLHRLPRERIERLHFSAPRGELRLERGARGWTVRSARPGSSVFGPESPAEPAAVEDLLGELGRYELAGFRRGVAWDAGPTPHRFSIGTAEEEMDATLGAAYQGAAGEEARLFQRGGETAVGLAPVSLLGLLSTPPEALWRLLLRDTLEANLVALALEGGEKQVRFVRNAKGLWIRDGGELEARELRPLLDQLVFLKASRHLGEEGQPPLADVVVVTFTEATGVRAEFRIGTAQRDGAAGVEVEYEGRRSLLASPGIHAALLAML